MSYMPVCSVRLAFSLVSISHHHHHIRQQSVMGAGWAVSRASPRFARSTWLRTLSCWGKARQESFECTSWSLTFTSNAPRRPWWQETCTSGAASNRNCRSSWHCIAKLQAPLWVETDRQTLWLNAALLVNCSESTYQYSTSTLTIA